MLKSTPDKFWAEVKTHSKNECWEWKKRKSPKGYGELSFQGKWYFAHRLAYILTFGNIPDGLSVCHRCDNRSCCNPNHLFLGTQQENIADMMQKGRQNHTSLRGSAHNRSKLTEPQVLEIRRLYATGNYTYKDLGQLYSCTYKNIHRIVKRLNWTHI